MEETNKDRIMRSILSSERLAALGDYNPTDFDTIDDALCSDNAIVKTVAMIIMGDKKTETQVYNEVSNYLINNIDV